ncbi:MAG TPA: HAMP domain-containing sensor histidine kinase [Candidatus Baltobacteraceae bacterium]|jgi:two-component system OmpR family sensor kinase
MFQSFGARITRSYVLLALALILLVVGTSTVLAFLLYAATLNDGVNSATQRVTSRAAAFAGAHETIAQFAPKLVGEAGHGRIEIAVYGTDRRLIAGKTQAENAHRRAIGALATILGLHRATARIPGGVVVIRPDLDRFGGLLLRYWSIMLAVGALALVAAWLVGRRITRRAIGPLEDVSRALHVVAAGDFQPQPLRGRSGELRELTEAYNDVAHRLTAETAERQRTETQMRQFVADAGHELRTPLTVVMGYLDVLRDGVVSDPAGISRVYETMLDESRRMRNVIEKLILLARLERPLAIKHEIVDIAELARRAVKELSPFANNAIRLDAPAEAMVASDSNELYEAIKNIIDNALKYAPASDVEIVLATANGVASMRVSDDGPGMDEQDRAHAFDRFYRGDARTTAEGSGLGLAIAKRVIERSGGNISIESTPGTGTNVTLTLPLSQNGELPS